MHITHLTFQHNDAVDDLDDARDKYVARQFFRNLVRKGSIPTSSIADDDFRPWCEDLTPSNVLIDRDLRIMGVVDWEFAPARFTFNPPWWLILQKPEGWSAGYNAFMEAHEPRLQTFLRVLEAEEKKMAAGLGGIVPGLLAVDDGKTEPPLSQRMRQSWEERTWMVNYAARKSWAFDFIWWKYLDERYFGPNEDQDNMVRLGLLSEPQRKMMETLWHGRWRKEKIVESSSGKMRMQLIDWLKFWFDATCPGRRRHRWVHRPSLISTGAVPKLTAIHLSRAGTGRRSRKLTTGDCKRYSDKPTSLIIRT